MKVLLMTAYGAIFAISLWIFIAFVVAIGGQPAIFRVANVPQSGIFMALFMCTIMFVQLRNPLRISLMIEVSVVGLLWLLTWLSHAYQNATLIIGFTHALLAVVFGLLNMTKMQK